VPDDYTYIGTGNYLQTTETVCRLWGQRVGAEYGEPFHPAWPLRVGENIGALLDSLGGFRKKPGRTY
jgi:hypothetical protein